MGSIAVAEPLCGLIYLTFFLDQNPPCEFTKFPFFSSKNEVKVVRNGLEALPNVAHLHNPIGIPSPHDLDLPIQYLAL